MDVLIDFHSHILPEIDDGSSSPEESVAMLSMEAEQGISCVVLTPHFRAWEEHPEDFLLRRANAEAALRRGMENVCDLPAICLGAEVAYFRGISESDALGKLAISGGNAILIEMPPAPWPEKVYEELEQIWHNWGILPVIAHIDRYVRPLRTYGIPERLAQLPVFVQANASFFLRRGTCNMAMRMLKKNQIHLLGSDCHNMNSRKPNLEAAASRICEKLGREAILRICAHQRRALGLDQITLDTP